MDVPILSDIAVLLVQDDAVERVRTHAALLACCRADRVAVAASGAEAGDFLLGRGVHSARSVRKLPRLVLMDLDPAAGLAMLDALRSEPPLSALPVVVLTGSGDRASQDAWYRAGANSVVGKTRNDDELRLKMRCLHDYWTTVNVTNRFSRV